MTVNQANLTQRLAWLEGVRIFAAVMILLYHAQLMMTHYAFTPQPSGLLNNLGLMGSASDRLGHHPLLSILSLPVWFGFQFVDLFVLISGFSLVLSLHGKPLETGTFLKRRFLRILAPLWTIIWLAYPLLWLLGTITSSYIPDVWNFFAAATFPLLYDFAGQLLLPINGPWWFVSLILSFTLIFPFLWSLLRRWGALNLLLMSLLLTLAYRVLAVYAFGGHPTYAIVETRSNWLPFLPFLAKLSTFIVGMVVGQWFQQARGPLFWQPGKALVIGAPIYLLGFASQFYWAGWVIADLLVPIGLGLCCMAFFQILTRSSQISRVFLMLGAHSYSFFLIHNFVVDRTLNLIVHDSLDSYYLALPIIMGSTLLLSIFFDQATPILQRWITVVLQDIDWALSRSKMPRSDRSRTKAGDRVSYSSKGH